jgi:hypothetical protein
MPRVPRPGLHRRKDTTEAAAYLLVLPSQADCSEHQRGQETMTVKGAKSGDARLHDGSVFGNWVVVSFAGVHKRNGTDLYMATCALCGKIKKVEGAALRYGNTSKCRDCSVGPNPKSHVPGTVFGGWEIINRVSSAGATSRCQKFLVVCRCGLQAVRNDAQLHRNKYGCRACAAAGNGRKATVGGAT